MDGLPESCDRLEMFDFSMSWQADKLENMFRPDQGTDWRFHGDRFLPGDCDVSNTVREFMWRLR